MLMIMIHCLTSVLNIKKNQIFKKYLFVSRDNKHPFKKYSKWQYLVFRTLPPNIKGLFDFVGKALFSTKTSVFHLQYTLRLSFTANTTTTIEGILARPNDVTHDRRRHNNDNDNNK